jgi:preprotein translocase subunit SecB
MADSSDTNKGNAVENTAKGDEAARPRLSVRAQYIKDLSFESPNSPNSLLPQKEQPKIDVDVNLNAQKVGEDMYESSLQINVKATVEGKPFFLVELSYGGLFAIQNFKEEQLEPILLIECPFVIFPFARRVIADVTRDGGFPPLMLEPIDFHRLYAARKQAEQEQKKAS